MVNPDETLRIGVFYRREGVGVGLMQGVSRYCREHKHLHHTHFGDLSAETAAHIIPNRLQGIIAYIPSDDFIARIIPRDIPVVNVANVQLHMDIPSVVVNNEMIGTLAAEHLLRTGIRHMACRTILHHQGMQQRILAFRQHILAAGCSCIMLPVDFAPANGTPESQAFDAQRLKVLPRPLGIFAANDTDAETIIRITNLAGLNVPADIALVGVDNAQEVCEHTQPAITSIDLNADHIGYEATRLLDCLMTGKRVPSRAIIIPPAGIVSRASTDVLAVGDPDLHEAIRFIRDNAARRISIAQIAARCGLSRRTLERRVREHLGHSLHNEIESTRMAHAEELLRTSNLPIAHIARLCGFRSQGYFTRAVRRHFGRTPGALRARQ